MAEALAATPTRLDPRKFRDPLVTATGERRAQVALKSLDTLWFNTGTLCNLTCRHCYIESSPRNDRLVYLSAAEVAEYLRLDLALDKPLDLAAASAYLLGNVAAASHDILRIRPIDA